MALALPNVNQLTMERPTLSTIAQNLDKEGKWISLVAEVLMKSNAILPDIPMVEANSFLEHMSTYEISMPKAFFYEFNRGIPASYGENGQQRETLSQFSSRSEIDSQLYELNNNGPQWRFDQDKRHIRALNDAMTETVFYGDQGKNPLSFNGLATRYNMLDPKVSQKASQVKSLGGKKGKRLSSIYAVSWGETTCHGLYPKGGKGTLDYKDRGEIFVDDGAGRRFAAYVSEYFWRFGIAVPDYRSVVRICNIDIEDVLAGKGMGTGKLDAEGATNILLEINNALRNLDPTNSGGKKVLYANKDVIACLQNCAIRSDATQVRFTEVLADNKSDSNVQEFNFNGYTLKRCDSISSDEDEVK